MFLVRGCPLGLNHPPPNPNRVLLPYRTLSLSSPLTLTEEPLALRPIELLPGLSNPNRVLLACKTGLLALTQLLH
jgi:hypothetical protein